MSAGGKKQVKLRLGLGPALDDGVVFAASHKGEALAVSVDTGKQLWVRKLKLPLSAGPAAGSGMVIFGFEQGPGHRAERGDGQGSVAQPREFGIAVGTRHQR